MRSYDPQLGRFLQHDPYDQFASGYVGMGNDPANGVDPTGGFVGIPPAFFEAIQKMGGTLDNVTVIAKAKTVTTISSSGALIDATKRIIEGGRIINSAFQKPSLFQRIGQFFLSAGPVIARGASVIGGVLIPISTGEGASFSKEQNEAHRKQVFEKYINDPSEASDQYLNEVEERLNRGKATSNDWNFKDEINRRKTQRSGKVHGHHSYPKALGGAAEQKLTKVLDDMHTGPDGIHSDLAKFEGGWLRPKKGMTGAKIVEKY